MKKEIITILVLALLFIAGCTNGSIPKYSPGKIKEPGFSVEMLP